MIATLGRNDASKRGSSATTLTGAYSTTVVSMASVLSDTYVLIAEVVTTRDVAANKGFPQTASLALANCETAADRLREIRSVLGLTWEELAELFGVKRRSVHFWASGKRMTPEHATRLELLREFAATVDRGDSKLNHDLLIEELPAVESPMRLLIDGKFTAAMHAVGRHPQRRATFKKVRTVHIENDELPPPDAFLNALHDPVGPTSGRRLRSKKIGAKRGV
ncbi:MAG: helix-turn-helix transcriptional regulator [Planctomycetes bacterium]|nr:helix-turn-helix transcriptional regulator [Planctomycetota bacterium]